MQHNKQNPFTSSGLELHYVYSYIGAIAICYAYVAAAFMAGLFLNPAFFGKNTEKVNTSILLTTAKPITIAQKHFLTVKESSATIKESPAIAEESSATIEESPAITEESSATIEESPAITEESSATIEESPAITEESSATIEESPATIANLLKNT